MVESDIFYTRIDDIDDTVVVGDPAIYRFSANINQAIARGAEVQLKYRFNPKRSVYMNYTYEHITDWLGNDGRSLKIHRACGEFRWMMISGMILRQLQRGYKDSYFISLQDIWPYTPTGAGCPLAYALLGARTASCMWLDRT